MNVYMDNSGILATAEAMYDMVNGVNTYYTVWFTSKQLHHRLNQLTPIRIKVALLPKFAEMLNEKVELNQTKHDIEQQIQEQTHIVNNLKISRAQKEEIENQVKILLDLKMRRNICSLTSITSITNINELAKIPGNFCYDAKKQNISGLMLIYDFIKALEDAKEVSEKRPKWRDIVMHEIYNLVNKHIVCTSDHELVEKITGIKLSLSHANQITSDSSPADNISQIETSMKNLLVDINQQLAGTNYTPHLHEFLMSSSVILKLLIDKFEIE